MNISELVKWLLLFLLASYTPLVHLRLWAGLRRRVRVTPSQMDTDRRRRLNEDGSGLEGLVLRSWILWLMGLWMLYELSPLAFLPKFLHPAMLCFGVSVWCAWILWREQKTYLAYRQLKRSENQAEEVIRHV